MKYFLFEEWCGDSYLFSGVYTNVEEFVKSYIDKLNMDEPKFKLKLERYKLKSDDLIITVIENKNKFDVTFAVKIIELNKMY